MSEQPNIKARFVNCSVCGKETEGRADKKYCSLACRNKAYSTYRREYKVNRYQNDPVYRRGVNEANKQYKAKRLNAHP